MRRPRRIALAVAATGLLTTLAACGVDERQDVFTPEGENADRINRLQVPVMGIALLVGLFVAIALFVIIRSGLKRSKEGADDPQQLEGNFKLEIAWTIAPAVLLAGIAVFTVATLFEIDDADADALDGVHITVYGQQWWWAYEYDLDGDDQPEIVTANDLVIPAGVDVSLTVTSRDVIHSFWIPALNGTRDAVPGRMHTLVLHADEPGIFDGQCKEFCGLSHANMKQRAVALSPAEWETWLDQQQETQPMLAEGDEGYEGQQIFLAQCTTCHQINGLEDADGNPIVVEGNAGVVARHAPNLTHLMTRGVFAGALFDLYDRETGEFNRSTLEAWIRNPIAEKPMYLPAEGTPRGMPDLGLTEDQIDDVVDYLMTLHPEGADRPPIQTNSETDD